MPTSARRSGRRLTAGGCGPPPLRLCN